MFVVVSYDIKNDKRRRKVMKLMEGYGERVQYSVFECHLQPRNIVKPRSFLRIRRVQRRHPTQQPSSRQRRSGVITNAQIPTAFRAT